jgi:hypothetical protein
VISGPSHAGKNILLAQQMDDWAHGRDVFGGKSHPAPYCYISANRTPDMIRQQFEQLGIDHRQFPHFSMLDPALKIHPDERNLVTAIAIAKGHVPHGLRVLWIAGFTQLCQGKLNDDKDVSRFLIEALDLCDRHEITIGGATVRSAKAREGDGYASPIDRIMGSAVWSELTATKSIIQPIKPREPECAARTIYVLPRSRRTQRLYYEIDDTGRLMASATAAEMVAASQLDGWLEVEGGAFTTKEITVAAEIMGISRSTVTRWIKTQRELGTIQADVVRGRWMVVSDNPAN